MSRLLSARLRARFAAALLLTAPFLAAPFLAAADEAPRVALDTSQGRIVLELDPGNAPATVENFLGYVKDGFYDGTIFHRVIDGFMIQGGGFDESFQKKQTRDPIRNEADNGLRNDRGTVAMARTGNPHSATAQFFINVVDNEFLNHTAPSARGWGYAVFGRVVEGMAVVDAIKSVPTGRNGPYSDVPTEAVIIQSATLLGE